jgi:hypothetical protein
MRIVFGLVTFNSVLDLSFVLYDFFSDGGVAPRSLLLGQLRRGNSVCIYDLAGPPWVLVTLYVLTLVSILAFAVGWHTRLASIATFFLVCGIHERNLQVFDGSDNVLRVMLFWLMFMPTGARYSLDAVLRAARGLPTITHGPALPIRIGQVQIAWVYLNTIIYKWPGVEWQNGTALRIALGLDHLFTRTLGHFIYNQEWLTRIGTHFTVVTEISFLPLVFIWWNREQAARFIGLKKRPVPWWSPGQPTLKGLAILLGTGLHLGIATMMSVGHFSYIMISTYFLLYEPEWIERVVGLLDRDRFWGAGKLKVIFDGDYPPGARAAAVLRGLDVYRRLDLINLREPGSGVKSLPKGGAAPRLNVLDESGNAKAGFAAWIRIGRRLPALVMPSLLGAITAPLIGPAIDRAAARGQAAAASVAPTVPSSSPGSSGTPGSSGVPAGVTFPVWLWHQIPERLLRILTGVLYATLAVLMALCMWFSLPKDGKVPPLWLFGKEITPLWSTPQMPDVLHQTIEELELWQQWNMFSPKPLDSDMYLMGRGRLADDTEVDVLRGDRGGGAPPLLPPVDLQPIFTRWTKYLNNIETEEGKDSPWVKGLADFICTKWNYDRHNRPPLKTFKLFKEYRPVPLFRQTPDEWKEFEIWNWNCP